MKALVVDDHVLIRDAMSGVLLSVCDGAVVLDCATAKSAIALIEAHPDIALCLLDVNLPDRNGLDVLLEMRERFPALSVVMLSGTADPNVVATALERGAHGFIPKTESRAVLISALRLVLSGGLYIPPVMLGRSAAAPADAPSLPYDPAAHRTPTDLGLTERQLEVLALMMEGKSNKLICRALSLAEPTVKNHVSAILKALGVGSRTEAVLAVSAHGWKLPTAKR
jgi:DNA-binding NarL/FixJ family response regulator